MNISSFQEKEDVSKERIIWLQKKTFCATGVPKTKNKQKDPKQDVRIGN